VGGSRNGRRKKKELERKRTGVLAAEVGFHVGPDVALLGAVDAVEAALVVEVGQVGEDALEFDGARHVAADGDVALGHDLVGHVGVALIHIRVDSGKVIESRVVADSIEPEKEEKKMNKSQPKDASRRSRADQTETGSVMSA
jgi:hypothetical protein